MSWYNEACLLDCSSMNSNYSLRGIGIGVVCLLSVAYTTLEDLPRVR